MKNLKKYLIALVLLFVALVLVACGDTPEDTPETPADTTVKIATINVYPTIYDGEEASPYVLVGQEIYFEAELLAADESQEPTEKETWSIADPTIAEMTVNEDGGIICKGLKAGSTTVTAKNPDGTISADYKFEVAISKNAQDVLVAANQEIQENFPKYITADTTLPVPANPNVTIKYKTSITNGITVNNGVYKYAYKDSIGDVNKQINFTLTYHKQVFEGNAYFYEVKDANDNLFVTSEKVAAKIDEVFATMAKANDKDGNPTDLPLIENYITLPNGYTTAEVGREIGLVWATDTTKSVTAYGKYTKLAADTNVVLTATVGIKTVANLTAGVDEVLDNAASTYYVLYEGTYNETINNQEITYTAFMPLDGTMTDYYTTVDSKRCAKEGVTYYTYTPISKHAVNIVAAGTPAEDIVAYFFTKKLAPADGQVLVTKDLSKMCYNLKFSDTTKKYTGLTVEWTLDEDVTGVQILESKGQIMFKAAGEYTLHATFYYNKRMLPSYFGTSDTAFQEGKTYYWYDNSTKSYAVITVPTEEEIANALKAVDDAKAELAAAADDEAKTAAQTKVDKAQATYDDLVAKTQVKNYFEYKETETYLWKITRDITFEYQK